MTRTELIECLDRTPRYGYTLEDEDVVAIMDMGVGEKDDHPITAFWPDAVAKLTWAGVRAHAAQGRDIDHVTRVTGYFSRTSGWNKGKTAELRDRAKGAL